MVFSNEVFSSLGAGYLLMNKNAWNHFLLESLILRRLGTGVPCFSISSIIFLGSWPADRHSSTVAPDRSAIDLNESSMASA